MYYIIHMSFGKHIRRVREARKAGDKTYSLRQVARRIGIEPAYLSKVEREEVRPPSEEKIRLLAGVLGEDQDVLLGMAGKISSDLQSIIRRRPRVFAALLRALSKRSSSVIADIVRLNGNDDP
jgi:transcriptional regulator with XRE-family HTH domain